MPSTLTYKVRDRIATITLNRPARLNAINDAMPSEIRAAVAKANADDKVHVIILQGAGDVFCAGYDLKAYAEGDKTNVYTQEMPWDPMRDYRFMKQNTEDFMSLWRSYKPTICKVQGYALAGGSDIALCCDFVIMASDAKIGYPPARVWGCPTTAMWVYRLGPMLAKRMLFSGDMIDGITAKQYNLVLDAVPAAELDAAVLAWANRLKGVPRNQLMMQKLMINQAFNTMGMENTQMFATIFDGITRHSPEGTWFKKYAEANGFHAAVEWRDSGRDLPQPLPGEDAGKIVQAAGRASKGAKSKWSRSLQK